MGPLGPCVFTLSSSDDALPGPTWWGALDAVPPDPGRSRNWGEGSDSIAGVAG